MYHTQERKRKRHGIAQTTMSLAQKLLRKLGLRKSAMKKPHRARSGKLLVRELQACFRRKAEKENAAWVLRTGCQQNQKVKYRIKKGRAGAPYAA